MKNRLYSLVSNALRFVFVFFGFIWTHGVVLSQHSITNHYDVSIEIASTSSFDYTVSKSITVFDKRGQSHASVYVVYDKFQKVKIKTLKFLDKNAHEIKDVRKSEFTDVSFISNYSLYEDNRVIYFDYEPTSFPYTVIFEYDVTHHQTIAFPTWIPQWTYDQEVKHASLKISYPNNNPIRYKNLNIGEPETTNLESQTELKWEVTDLKSFDKEPYSVAIDAWVPVIYLAPTQFSYDGSKGVIHNWSDFGKWMQSLMTGRNDLPEEAITIVNEIKSNYIEPIEQIKHIYQYVQNNTRYVSIQLGIGGYQPFPASYVHKYGYGDCKALTNYTQSLLEVAGIKSHYAIVGAGNHKSIRFEDFPSVNQANHVILCVPLESRDTLWLECTSQKAPFGFVGEFTANRKAFIIDADGGEIVSTPVYKETENIVRRSIKFSINEDGIITGKATMARSGIMYEDALVNLSSSEDQMKKLKAQYHYPDLQFANLICKEKGDQLPVGIDKFDFSIDNYVRKIGSKMILNPLLFVHMDHVPKDIQDRQVAIKIPLSIQYYDTISVILPDRFALSKDKPNFQFENEFGSYTFNVSQQDHGYIITKHRIFNAGIFPPESYENLRSLLSEIKSQENKKWLLENKT